MTRKPPRRNAASPYLVVTDAQAMLDFLAAVFDAETLLVHRREDGSVMHAEALIDDSVVMMGEMPEAQPAMIHVYVPDAAAAHARALAAGAASVQEPQAKEDGDLRGGVRGPDGVLWYMASLPGGAG